MCSITETCFLDGSQIFPETTYSKYCKWTYDITNIVKSVTNNVLSKRKELYNLIIEEIKNVLISIITRE